MDFATVVERTGGDVVGGQLIVRVNNANLLVGTHQNGVFLPDQGEAAQAYLKTLTVALTDDVPGKTRRRAKADAETFTKPVVSADEPQHFTLTPVDRAEMADSPATEEVPA